MIIIVTHNMQLLTNNDALKGVQESERIEVFAVVLLETSGVARGLDTSFHNHQLRKFGSMFPASLEYIKIKYGDNAIVEPDMDFLRASFPKVSRRCI
jgi:hypothetical protein